MHKRKELYRRIVITIAVLVCAACAIGYGSRQIETELSEQMYNSMKVVAKQNGTILRLSIIPLARRKGMRLSVKSGRYFIRI